VHRIVRKATDPLSVLPNKISRNRDDPLRSTIKQNISDGFVDFLKHVRRIVSVVELVKSVKFLQIEDDTINADSIPGFPTSCLLGAHACRVCR
jgi:hypothetical protein